MACRQESRVARDRKRQISRHVACKFAGREPPDLAPFGGRRTYGSKSGVGAPVTRPEPGEERCAYAEMVVCRAHLAPAQAIDGRGATCALRRRARFAPRPRRQRHGATCAHCRRARFAPRPRRQRRGATCALRRRARCVPRPRRQRHGATCAHGSRYCRARTRLTRAPSRCASARPPGGSGSCGPSHRDAAWLRSPGPAAAAARG
jgi:hypothetical protein